MEVEKQIRNILLFLSIILMFTVLKQLATLLIPLALAGLLIMLELPIVKARERMRIPQFFIRFLVALASLGVVFLVILMISGVVKDMAGEQASLSNQLRKQINIFFTWLARIIPEGTLSVETLKEEFFTLISPERVVASLTTLARNVSSFGSSIFLFFLYYLILLFGATRYQGFVRHVAGEEKGIGDIWLEIQQSISIYVRVKTFTSLLTGLVVGLICKGFGIRYALFWGFLTFLFNYIPSIGSIFATVLPLLMAIVQFGSGVKILLILAALGLFQFLIGSVLDPYLLGNRLRLNTVTVIFGLFFWGYIWGIPGMLFSVPFMVVIRLFLERNQNLAIVARIMGYPETTLRRPKKIPPQE